MARLGRISDDGEPQFVEERSAPWRRPLRCPAGQHAFPGEV